MTDAQGIVVDGRFRRPPIVVFLIAFDVIAGLLAAPLVLLLQMWAPRWVLLPGLAGVFGGLCWGAALSLWRMTPRGRTLQLVVGWLGLVVAPPLSTLVFLPVLVLMRRPGAHLLFSGRPPDQLSEAEMSDVVRFVHGSNHLVAAAAIGVAVLNIVGMAIVGLLQAAGTWLDQKIAPNEAAALKDIRELIAAEKEYAKANGAYFDVPGCLREPSRCAPDHAALATHLPVAVEGPSAGYVRRFYSGPAVDTATIGHSKLSATSLRSFAYVAAPQDRGTTGRRSFCVDGTGLIRFSVDGHDAEPVDGTCPRTMMFLP